MQLINGTHAPNDPGLFRPLYNSLLNTQSTAKADTYFILKGSLYNVSSFESNITLSLS